MSEQKVERETVVSASLEEVWQALTDETLLEEWLAPEVELEPREGGEVSVRTEDGEERTGTVEEFDEGRRLAFRWGREGVGQSRVELTVDAVAGGARVVVVETGPALAPGAGWGPRLAALRSASTLALA